MSPDYAALVILIVVSLLVVYGVVAVWGVPCEIARQRNHPHQDATGAGITAELNKRITALEQQLHYPR